MPLQETRFALLVNTHSLTHTHSLSLFLDLFRMREQITCWSESIAAAMSVHCAEMRRFSARVLAKHSARYVLSALSSPGTTLSARWVRFLNAFVSTSTSEQGAVASAGHRNSHTYLGWCAMSTHARVSEGVSE